MTPAAQTIHPRQRVFSTLGLSLLLVAVMSHSTWAGPNQGAYLVFHVTESTPNGCYASNTIPGCDGLRSESSSGVDHAYTYVLVEHGDVDAGIGSVHFGIAYYSGPGASLNILDWTLCADYEVPVNWPASTSGLTVSWDPGNCQHRMSGNGDPYWDGGAAVLGYFYTAAYGPANLSFYPHPQTGTIDVTDCGGTMDPIEPGHLGTAGFQDAGGVNPCQTQHAYRCGISGDSECEAGTSGHVYETTALGTDLIWYIEGNGTIVGPADQQTVTVQAGGPGTFKLTSRNSDTVYGAYVCGKIVTVLDAVPAEPVSWSRIKLLYPR